MSEHPVLLNDLRFQVAAAAARLGRDGNGAGGLRGYLEHLAAKYPKTLPRRLQAAGYVALNVDDTAKSQRPRRSRETG